MPINKNVLTRLQILDDLLSDKAHNYTMSDLQKECEKRLSAVTDPDKAHVGLRQIQKDIKYIEYESPFMATIKRESVVRFSKETMKNFNTQTLRYEDPSFSIFQKKLTDEEKSLMKVALDILGQFNGIPGLERLDALRSGLEIAEHDKIIDFGDMHADPVIFGKLFMAAAHKQAVYLVYHLFSDMNTPRTVLAHPYLLKDYNKRWSLIFGADDTGKILNFRLDQIDDVIPKLDQPFKEPIENLDERLEEIVGVSFYEKHPCKEILFWVSEDSVPYVETKKIHLTQITYDEDFCVDIRKKHPELKGGRIFSIECRENRELYQEFLSYGKDLVVLEEDIRKKMQEIVIAMSKNYLV